MSKKPNESMTEQERTLVSKLMNKQGHKKVKPEDVYKVPNKYGFDVYVAVVGDAMVVYTPQWDYHNDGGFNFVCF